MTLQLVVADACSIMNFAPIDRMPLLNVALRERGRWTQAVEGEIRRSANTLEFRKLSALLQGGWLGEPIELDSAEDLNVVEGIRMALGGVPSAPRQHLGEAESIRAIESRPELKGAIFLTDDGDATYLATRRGITVKDTRWLISDAYSMGDIGCPEAYEVLKMMTDAARPIKLPDSHIDICP